MGCCGFFGKLAKACDDVDTCDKDHCCETNWMVIILIIVAVLGLKGGIIVACKCRMAAKQKQRDEERAAAAAEESSNVPMMPSPTPDNKLPEPLSLARLQSEVSNTSATRDCVPEEQETVVEDFNKQEPEEEEDEGLNADTIAARKAAAAADEASGVATYGYSGYSSYGGGVSSSKGRCNDWIGGSGYPAYLCNSWGCGAKKDNCCVCDKWVAATKYRAQLCTSCGIGAKSDNCSKCGDWCGGSKYPAYLCSDCGFGNRKENCCKLKS